MNKVEQKTDEIQALLVKFVETLNRGDRYNLSTFFSEDALFMPDHFKTLTGEQLHKNRNSSYLTSLNLKIHLDIATIVIHDSVAIVEAYATTQTKASPDLEFLTKNTRDSFILKQYRDDWKIIGYIFNEDY